jgi:hypothetical protein
MSTKRQITNRYYNTQDDNTVKMGNISTPAIHEDIYTGKEKEVRMKTMDINEAHYNMGHMGEIALRFLNHHNIQVTGKFQNCISCMKWKAQTSHLAKLQ